MIVKNPNKGYKIHSILAVIFNTGILLLIIGVIFSSSKWERDYQKYINAGEYQNALEILDNHYVTTLSEQGVEYYFDTFALSDNYQDLDKIVLKYYETLNDKTDFKESIFDKINTLTDKLNEKQIEKLKEIEANVKTAKEEKEKQLEEESRAKAESESIKAEEEAKAKAKAKAESESIKAEEEAKAKAKSESIKAEEEAKATKENTEKNPNESAKSFSNKTNAPIQKSNYQINDPVKTGKFEFTVTNAYVLDDLGSNKKVPEGAVYVVVEFEYKNISKQPISSFDLPSVMLMDNNEAIYSRDYDASWYFDGYSDEKIISKMNPGIKTKGSEIFEVAIDVLEEDGMKAYVEADTDFQINLNLSYNQDINSDTPYYNDTGTMTKTPYIIIENSSTAYLSDSDIYWMTPEQLRYAKNEIYARHGRKFKDRELQEWFNAQSWYHGRIESEDFNENMLSAIEKANILVIQHRLEVNNQ